MTKKGKERILSNLYYLTQRIYLGGIVIFIEKEIGRCNRNFLLANLLMFAAITAILFAYSNDLRDVWNGPVEVDASEITSVKDIKEVKNRYVTFRHEGEQPITLKRNMPDFNEYVQRFEELNHYYLHFVKVQDKYLMVTANTKYKLEPGEVSGTLYGMVQEQEIYDAVVKFSKDPINVLPFKLDASGTLKNNVNALLSVCAPFICLFIINMIRYLIRLLKPESHFIYRRLRKFGDPKDIAANINIDMVSPNVMYKKYLVAPNWIVKRELFSIKVARNFGRETNVLQMTFKH
ncbi:hypothetical protein [Paenibacillus hamazuiensis]|uniref:hypothetical protein n=1 Tax=Paenibacillus hamazuiensis TaxID=2936508 RepID=UPI002010B335|nr:hypothetical protein [Paenibacillus hamazuiensis]